MPAEERAELAAQGRMSVTVLEAANSAAAGPQRSAQCDVTCSCDGQQLWRDRLGSPAVQLAGSRHFAAAALADGTVQASPLPHPYDLNLGQGSIYCCIAQRLIAKAPDVGQEASGQSLNCTQLVSFSSTLLKCIRSVAWPC